MLESVLAVEKIIVGIEHQNIKYKKWIYRDGRYPLILNVANAGKIGKKTLARRILGGHRENY